MGVGKRVGVGGWDIDWDAYSRLPLSAESCSVQVKKETLASPVGEILLFLSLPPYQSSPKWASVPIEYTAGGYEMVPSLGRFRPPVACGGPTF